MFVLCILLWPSEKKEKYKRICFTWNKIENIQKKKFESTFDVSDYNILMVQEENHQKAINFRFNSQARNSPAESGQK